jgi:precorrin-8X/cobalt-precorrin-8 methylmutase
MFDTFVMVDWSAASVPQTGRDSIWICWHDRAGERLANPATRHQAKGLLGDWLAEPVARGERVLLGFDFPFGYPSGFAARLGLAGTPWRAVWDEIAGLLQDTENNGNNRFLVGAELNRRISSGRFPFWGCPARFSHEFLGPKHHRRHQHESLAEKRLIDCWMRGAQPCWKLAYTGSVGSQVLTGIPVVRALRSNTAWAARARIWPFETGLLPPEDAQIVFAEVWPSWWTTQRELGPPTDKAQVRTVAALFAARDRAGELASWFAPPVHESEIRQIVSEEAWTLGVMEPRRANRTLAAPVVLEKETNNGTYLRDPVEISRRSFALVRAEADLGNFPRALRPLALRLAHAAGDSTILVDLAWSRGAVAAGRRALAAGAPILVDSTMTAAGISGERLAAGNQVLCTLHDPRTAEIAVALGTTRSAAAVELWRPHLAGAIIAIGNAPTALYHLLEIIAAGAAKPALVLGFPVGFVGAGEAKEALAGFGRSVAYVTLKGRRGGSALAAAAVNALAGTE